MSAIDLVFDPEGDPSGGYHKSQNETAPNAWDHLDQASTTNDGIRPKALQNSITVSPHEAFAVIERSANKHTIRAIPIAGTLVSTQGPSELVENQKGRKFIVIQCPTTNTKGVYLSEEKDSLDSNPPTGWLLSPGDPPLKLETEDALWFKAVTGAVATDVVQIYVAWHRADKL